MKATKVIVVLAIIVLVAIAAIKGVTARTQAIEDIGEFPPMAGYLAPIP